MGKKKKKKQLKDDNAVFSWACFKPRIKHSLTFELLEIADFEINAYSPAKDEVINLLVLAHICNRGPGLVFNPKSGRLGTISDAGCEYPGDNYFDED